MAWAPLQTSVAQYIGHIVLDRCPMEVLKRTVSKEYSAQRRVCISSKSCCYSGFVKYLCNIQTLMDLVHAGHNWSHSLPYLDDAILLYAPRQSTSSLYLLPGDRNKEKSINKSFIHIFLLVFSLASYITHSLQISSVLFYHLMYHVSW